MELFEEGYISYDIGVPLDSSKIGNKSEQNPVLADLVNPPNAVKMMELVDPVYSFNMR